MHQKIKQFAIVGALMVGSFTAGMSLQPVLADSRGFGVFLEVHDHLATDYVKTNLDHDKLLHGAISGLLATLDDPYSRFLTKDENKEMKEEREGSFIGIGIHVALQDKKLTVVTPIEDTPAWTAGLKSGDHIMAVDGKSTENMELNDAVDLIRGKEGSSVLLQIQRKSNPDPMEIKVTRSKIKTKVVKSKMQTPSIGFIRLTSFMQNDATQEIKVALQKLNKKGMKALILDLRSNPGGLLQNAVDIGSLFIDKGPIVRVVDRKGKEDAMNADPKALTLSKKIPLVVLINEGSASASEILAGSLKDNKRATLIGKRSFGKGLVQTVYPLMDGSGLILTTQKYLTSGGTDINKKGIEPHITVEIPKELMNASFSEKNDPQLLKALSFLNQKLGNP